MNVARRKELRELHDRLNDVMIALNAIKDEENDYFDNMPEGPKGGDKGTRAEEVIDKLEEALDGIDTAMSLVEEAAE